MRSDKSGFITDLDDKHIRQNKRENQKERLVAHTGLEPVISALRGQRVNQLHQCAAAGWNYRFPGWGLASRG